MLRTVPVLAQLGCAKNHYALLIFLCTGTVRRVCSSLYCTSTDAHRVSQIQSDACFLYKYKYHTVTARGTACTTSSTALLALISRNCYAFMFGSRSPDLGFKSLKFVVRVKVIQANGDGHGARA